VNRYDGSSSVKQRSTVVRTKHHIEQQGRAEGSSFPKQVRRSGTADNGIQVPPAAADHKEELVDEQRARSARFSPAAAAST
jgi:hypothetical protein